MNIRNILIGIALGSLSCAHAEWVITDGVTMDDYVNSPRFYDSNKGYYWHASEIAKNEGGPLWAENGDYSFLGYLENRVSQQDKDSDVYNKFWYSPAKLTYDRSTCGRQASINMLQYWQSYYGVFAKDAQNLPYGYTYDRKYLDALAGTQSVKLGMVLYDNMSDQGSYFREDVNWYLQGERTTRKGYDSNSNYIPVMRTTPLDGGSQESGGYFGTEAGFFKDYFGEYSDTNKASNPDVYTYNLNEKELANVFYENMGYTQVNGQWEQTIKGQIAYVCVEPTAQASNTPPHALTCYGFNVDENGNLKSLLLTNSDIDVGDTPHGEYGAFIAYVGEDQALFKDPECTQSWTYGRDAWRLFYISSINTPQQLVDMYAQYISDEKSLSWNGNLDKWSADYTEYTTDALPDSEKTGWDVYVDAGDMAHHNHYATYYDPTRKVEFGDHGAGQRNVSVVGNVKAAGMVLSADAEGYTFKGTVDTSSIDLRKEASISLATMRSVSYPEDGSLIKEGNAVDIIENVDVFATNVSIQAGNLKFVDAKHTADSGVVKSGATLTLNKSTANITNMTLEKDSILAVEAPSIIDGTWELLGDATLQMTLSSDWSEPLLDIQGTLAFAEGALLNIELINADSLTAGTMRNLINLGANTSLDLSHIHVSNGDLSFDNGILSFTAHAIPEPTTATLSLLALTGLCARRRR